MWTNSSRNWFFFSRFNRRFRPCSKVLFLYCMQRTVYFVVYSVAVCRLMTCNFYKFSLSNLSTFKFERNLNIKKHTSRLNFLASVPTCKKPCIEMYYKHSAVIKIGFLASKTIDFLALRCMPRMRHIRSHQEGSFLEHFASDTESGFNLK